MGRRRRGGIPTDKENRLPDPTRRLPVKLPKSQGRSSLGQRRRERGERFMPFKRDSLEEYREDDHTSETSGLEVLTPPHKTLKSKIGSVLHPLIDYEQRRSKDEGGRGAESYEGNGKTETRICRSVPEKRNQFQLVMVELRSKVKKNVRDCDIQTLGVQERTLGTSSLHQRLSEIPGVGAEEMDAKGRSISPDRTPNSITGWLSRTGMLSRPQGDGSQPQVRRLPFRGDPPARGAIGFFGVKSTHMSSLTTWEGPVLDEISSIETERGPVAVRGNRGRRQLRKKGLNGHLRRSKSSSSLYTHSSNGLFSGIPHELERLSAEADVHHQARQLRLSLEKAERKLAALVAESQKYRAFAHSELDRLRTLYRSLDRTQEVRYRSLLDIFQENYKILGYVESNFDYVLSVVGRGKRSSVQEFFHNVLRLIADNMMASIFRIVQIGSRLYLHVFPKETDRFSDG